jgi:hypothetical protein
MKKPLSSIILIGLMVSVPSVSAPPSGRAQSETYVSNIINVDTSWTSANSPYNINGNILVNNGITLTLESGTTINLNGYMLVIGSLVIQQGVKINIQNASGYIQVDGVLQAIGTDSNPIRIIGSEGRSAYYWASPYYSAITFSEGSLGWNDQKTSGSIIENTIFSSATLSVSNSIKLAHNTFENSLSLNGGSPIVDNCTIESGLGVDGGSPVISNNRITGGVSLQGGGFGFANEQVTYIYDNSISGQILYLERPLESTVDIERNLLTSSNSGAIEIAFSTNVECSMIINNNTIINSAIGIHLHYGYPQSITNNNIYQNSINFQLDNDHSFNCTNNWWGTTDQQAIDQTIHDFKDDFTLVSVTYMPFLTEPNPQASPDPNALRLTSTPQPTTQTSLPTTPNQSGAQGNLQSNIDWMQIALFAALGVIVILVISVMVLVRQRNRLSKK